MSRPITERLNNMLQEEQASGCNTIDAYREFDRLIKRMKEENLVYLRKAKAEGKRVFGFGAPVKGNTMLNHFGVGPGLIECLVEKNQLRRGLYSPGMHIPIAIEDELQYLFSVLS